MTAGFPGGAVVNAGDTGSIPGICLPMQGTRVRSLVWEDPTCCWATKPVHHNYWACALEPASHNYWACMPQLPEPTCVEPMLRNKRSHRNEKPAHRNEEQLPLAATRESLCAGTKTQCSQKNKKQEDPVTKDHMLHDSIYMKCPE